MPAPDALSWLVGRESLRVVVLQDAGVDAIGHHPCSNYVELFYLRFLGPAALVTARHLSAELEVAPTGFTIPTASLARHLGLGTGNGRNAPVSKALFRLARFRLAAIVNDAYALRLAFPPLTPGQVRRLPSRLAEAHERLDRTSPKLTSGDPGSPRRSVSQPAGDQARSGNPDRTAAYPNHPAQVEEVLS